MDYYDLRGFGHEGFKSVEHRLSFRKGGSLDENRGIVRSDADVLLDPLDTGRLTVDSAVVEIARQRGVAIAISFRPFLVASRMKRARLIAGYKKLVLLCLKGGVRPLLVSGAENEWEVRSPHQLIAFGALLGLSLDQAKWAITALPASLLKRRRSQ